MTDQLLLISIGPMQDFIVSARRLRDLWFSSWALSEVSKAAALAIARSQPDGVRALVFPAPETPSELEPASSFTVANKLLVRLKQGLPVEIAGAAREAARGRLADIAKATFDRIPRDAAFERIMAERQIRDLLEFLWVALPLEREGDYAAQRSRLDALLGARKTTRTFAQIRLVGQGGWASPVPKSSLDGLRESVIPEPVYDRYRTKPGQLRKLYGVRTGERLCGVGLLKRLGQRGEDDRFFSTSHVAALPLLARLRAEHAEALNTYLRRLRELGVSDSDLGHVPGNPHPAFGHRDGHLLFEERLDDLLEGDNDADLKRKKEQARQALRAFLRAVFGGPTTSPVTPGAYYAVLTADGDGMGSLIDRQQSIEAHYHLSRTLASFAGGARQIITAYGGSCVYAGGDDALALVPLHRVVACAAALAGRFTAALAAFGDAGAAPSMSIGIALCHHLEPLQDALELARGALEDAKGFVSEGVSGHEKDALAVVLAKRGGGDTRVCGHWGKLDTQLHALVELVRRESDQLPHGVAHELRALAALGMNAETEVSEAMRILARKRAERGAHAVGTEILHKLKGWLDSGDLTVGNLAEGLIVAQTLATAYSQAGQPTDISIDATSDEGVET